jgi:hypothetical protein
MQKKQKFLHVYESVHCKKVTRNFNLEFPKNKISKVFKECTKLSKYINVFSCTLNSEINRIYIRDEYCLKLYLWIR